jgi:hypothetical protein
MITTTLISQTNLSNPTLLKFPFSAWIPRLRMCRDPAKIRFWIQIAQLRVDAGVRPQHAHQELEGYYSGF